MILPFSAHIVQFSPWPFLVSFSLLSLLLNSFLHLYSPSSLTFFEGSLSLRLFLFLFSFFYWFFDIFLESLSGSHPFKVSLGFFLGFSLFLLSELLIFFSLFYSYFYNSLIPDPSLGCLWPPLGISPIDYLSIPLFNTFLLLSSGISLTISHNLLFFPSFFPWSLSIFFLLLTLLLGLSFSYLQYFEYLQSSFDLSDSLFSSSFFILTGWHGIHVLIGSLFLFFSLISLALSFSSSPLSIINHLYHYTSFKWLFFSSIYWHLVDFIWLFLFFFLYIFPSFLL